MGCIGIRVTECPECALSELGMTGGTRAIAAAVAIPPMRADVASRRGEMHNQGTEESVNRSS